VLGIHRLMAEALTFVNVVGIGIATIAVAKWDGALDTAKLRSEIGAGASFSASPKPAE
jgi:aerobic C4-dicarboxylate transport protein